MTPLLPHRTYNNQPPKKNLRPDSWILQNVRDLVRQSGQISYKTCAISCDKVAFLQNVRDLVRQSGQIEVQVFVQVGEIAVRAHRHRPRNRATALVHAARTGCC